MPTALRIALLTALAMVAFAANSVLNRLALAGNEISATGYTGLRLLSGALVLGVLVHLGQGRRTPAGSWAGAAALAAYALAFSLAYLALSAGTGALILFASVQIGMLGWALWQGERPRPLQWAGFAIAFLSLGLLVAPGATAPSALGAGLMCLAGLSWAAYTLLGRGSRAALADTAGNFLRCAPLAAGLAVAGLWAGGASVAGWAYAIASGAVASGLGYALWYSVLPHLPRSTASFVQLTVPALAAAGGALVLAEPVTLRLALCSLGILGGVALALGAARRGG